MEIVLYVTLGLVAWCALSVPLGLVVGRAFALGDPTSDYAVRHEAQRRLAATQTVADMWVA